MIAADEIDHGLIRQASVTGALLIGNYIAWALGAPAWLAMVFFSLACASSALFFVRGPIARDLPIKLFVLACVVLALGSPTLGWDTRSIWMFHAKRLYFDSSLYAQFDNYASWSSNDYPDFVPALSATFARMLGHWSEPALKVTSVFALFPALLVAAACLKTNARQLIFVIALAFVSGDQIFDGYMDWLIAVYSCAAALLLFLLLDRGVPEESKSGLTAAAVVVITILTLTKNEGSATLAAILSGAVLVALTTPELKFNARAIAVIALSLILIAAWKIACVQFGVTSELASAGFLSRMLERASSFPNWVQILGALTMQKEFLAPLTLAALFAIPYGRDAYFRFLVSAAAIYFGVLVLVYLSTPRDLNGHLGSSADRTIMPVNLLLAYAVISTSALRQRVRIEWPWFGESRSEKVNSPSH